MMRSIRSFGFHEKEGKGNASAEVAFRSTNAVRETQHPHGCVSLALALFMISPRGHCWMFQFAQLRALRKRLGGPSLGKSYKLGLCREGNSTSMA